MRALIAGMGNVLRQDDGFGVIAAQCLLDEGGLPESVRVLEVGIGGIHLVQELLDPVDILVIIDAVDVGRSPGSVVVMDPEIVDVGGLSPAERRDQLADMHYAVPARALMLARALDILPAIVRLVGCQAADARSYGQGLSPEVADAVALATAEAKTILRDAGVEWVDGSQLR